jgi:histidinol dehydrogenase
MATVKILAGVEAARWIGERSVIDIDDEARATVEPIVNGVRERGDAALREFSERYDGITAEDFHATSDELDTALEELAPERRRALDVARANIECFHRAQRRQEAFVEVRPGVIVWRVFRPIERVGIYVPGGRASYPSSVLMSGIPARLAGCKEIVICVPPDSDGRAPTAVLAAAQLLDIKEVFAVGGAQAIAALAFGTETVERVHKIFGPGNRYVTAAKERVFGIVDIDMPAGPSEVVVLADDSANPEWVAADLISQAEHAPDTLAVCVTTTSKLADELAAAVERQLVTLPQPEVARESIARSAICVADDSNTAIAWVNQIAPEHLTLMTRDDEAALANIDNAGSVFLGPYSPVAAGDYAAGSNHVLPTGRRARAWSGLELDDFGRWMQVQRLSRSGLGDVAETVATLARWEGFEAHARAAEIRFDDEAA